jgi:two-component system OmpR family sensor kinase
MFTPFARRLTAWYVAAGVSMVLAVSLAFAVVAMMVYVHGIQDTIDTDARDAQVFALRAAIQRQSFVNAAVEIEKRLAHPGIRLVAAGPFPQQGRPASRPSTTRAPQLMLPTLSTPGPSAAPGTTLDARLPAASGPPIPPYVVANGQVFTNRDPRELRSGGSRMGFAIDAALGVHFQRIDLVDGELRIIADSDATQRVALWLLGGALLLCTLAGVLAWIAGRFITGQVLQPLVEVTRALQRFATRDFTPQSIAVAGKSDFDAIALAYNAAASQVAAAFAERAQAESQMRQFVADAGHELRTPLTIVLGYIDLLRRKADAGDQRSRRIFSAISIEGARMRTLIDNLVLLARMEGDDVRPPEIFELCPLLEQLVDARRLLEASLQIELDCAVDATVIGNESEVQEAIANVVDNAIKYAPGTPIRIATAATNDGVVVTVSDRGPGIHPDDREAIFDRFYRGATRGEVEGSGLGLAIAKRALERAGGMLVLAETSPAGTTFALHLRADRVRKREPRSQPAATAGTRGE